MVFHHRNGETKAFDLGLAGSGSIGMEAIIAEMAKCDVLCANCHLKLHWDERQAAKLKRTG